METLSIEVYSNWRVTALEHLRLLQDPAIGADNRSHQTGCYFPFASTLETTVSVLKNIQPLFHSKSYDYI
jgi:hypothetical protein